MIWDHSVTGTQENCGSELPIAIPYQQLIQTLLYLLYGNDMGSFSYRFDMVGNVPYQNHMKSIPYMAHRLSHIIPVYGPYMSHTTQFGKSCMSIQSFFAVLVLNF